MNIWPYIGPSLLLDEAGCFYCQGSHLEFCASTLEGGNFKQLPWMGQGRHIILRNVS